MFPNIMTTGNEYFFKKGQPVQIIQQEKFPQPINASYLVAEFLSWL